MATVIQSSTIPLGARLYLRSDGTVLHHIGNEQLRSQILTDLHSALYEQRPSIKRYVGTEVLIEPIHLPLSLIIFGAGADTIPVVQFAKKLGWRVTIVDCRASEATAARFSMADEIILTRREKLIEQVRVNERTIAVVMTHNYLDDYEIIKRLLLSAARYIGILEPKQRTKQLLQDLQTEGELAVEVELEKLYAPLGLDIGADTPEEIAIAIVAEIQAVVADRPAGFLKHRSGSIHTKMLYESYTQCHRIRHYKLG